MVATAPVLTTRSESALFEVHWSGWASQPYVRFYCSYEVPYVLDVMPLNNPADHIYSAGEAGHYTFDRELATCPLCLEIGDRV